MVKHFGFSSLSVGISAGLMTVLLLTIMPSSSDCFPITLEIVQELTGHMKTVTVDVEGKETVQILKKKIQKKTKIEPERQTLQHQHKELENDQKLEDCWIVENSEVLMLVDLEQKLINGSTNAFKIKKQLKKLIIQEALDNKTKEHIQSDSQRLTLQHGTTADKVVLNDTKQMEEYGIRKEKEVKEEKREKKEDKEEIKLTIWVNGTDTVQMLKQKIKNQMGNGPIPTGQTLRYNKKISSNQGQIEETIILMEFDRIKFDVWYDNGKTLSVEVQMTDTVKELKDKIKAKVDIPPEGQILFIQKTDSVLGDKMTMQECDILTGKQIHLKKKKENEEGNVKEENEKKEE
ncbi:hypothetical protein niasHT_028254 [Heterodera trifolii]|uniref:Ubiquitin-like domain-containing protein n=1 Tax=Heterodera trifolii TaxID=157864 RepID=A0ABD2JUG8_9BILA